MSPVKQSRRSFLQTAAMAPLALSATRCVQLDHVLPPPGRPNVILCMADDLGWGDTGYNGHPNLQTPNLDDMARQGLRFDRFYSGAPVCSPTRGSCLTGRHPYRYGVWNANAGHLRDGELNVAELLKSQGYRTGIFGKWHLGTLTTTVRDSNRGGQPENAAHYNPPWDQGFDEVFVTEAKVPTCDPMLTPGTSEPYGTYYWTGPGERATENLSGDDSRVIMDRAIPFIHDAAAAEEPFFAVIWFHAPHLPTVAEPGDRRPYQHLDGSKPDYYGCITAMDEQVGRLRAELRRLGVADNTMLWFTSDNGPEGGPGNPNRPGSTAGLRGRKRSLHEGGVRVPGLLEWPERIPFPRSTSMPCSTLDYYPTILDLLDLRPPDQPLPIDGVSLIPLIEERMTHRPRPIAFQSGNRISLVDNRFKIVSEDKGRTWMLFDIVDDPRESSDLAASMPGLVKKMQRDVETWRRSCSDSAAGEDYE